VISTGQAVPPGSSGRTWPSSRALSRRMSIRLPASVLRYSAACASSVSGILTDGTCRADSRPRIASPGVTGQSEGPKPRRLT